MSVAEATVPAPPEHNQIGLNYRLPTPRPKIRGAVIDAHCHIFFARHGKQWFETAKHYGIDAFLTMTPFEECMRLQREHGERVKFIAVPKFFDERPDWVDDWTRRLDMFHNIGSRMAKFHMAPGTIERRKYHFEHPGIRRVMREMMDRNMIIMSHVGDPDTWYSSKYTDHAKFGTRDEHYRQWESALEEYGDRIWIGAHMGGNPEDPHRLQELLDRHPKLYLDLSATRWMVREVSARRDQMRDFVIRNQDRLLWGSDQVSLDGRDFDFLASRWWAHRKLWETAHIGPTPIFDPDLSKDQQPTLRGLALPDEVLQKIYHDNITHVLGTVGVAFDL